MIFKIEDALKYIENKHHNMFNIIKKNDNLSLFNLERLKDCLLSSSDCFILSFVKHFNLDISFFTPYDSYHIKELIINKWFTTYYLLSLNDEYKKIDWSYHQTNDKTYFGYLINNLLCVDMIKYLIENNVKLLNINNIYKNCIYISCLEELLKDSLSNRIGDFSNEKKKYNYPLYDSYNDDLKMRFNDFNDDYLEEQKIKLNKNSLELSIYLHNKLIENNIIFRYGLYTTIINKKFIEYEGILIKSIKLQFFDFVDYLLNYNFVDYNFICYTEENKNNIDKSECDKEYMDECYYKENDFISICIKYVNEHNEYKVIEYIKEYFTLLHNQNNDDLIISKKDLYIELSHEYSCYQILQFLS